MEIIRDEMDLMARNKVLELFDPPPQHKFIGNKWVFKIERWADGSIDKLKTCLVVKGLHKLKV